MATIAQLQKTGKALQWLLDNPEKIDGAEGWLEEYELNTDILPVADMYYSDPTCIDYYTNGVVEVDVDRIQFVYNTGYYWDKDPGTVETIHPASCNTLSEPCKARFICTLPLDQELEFQADNGELAYWYTGPRFFAAYETIEKEN